MAKKTNEIKTSIEEVVCPSNGKVYLPPCQIRCPLAEDIQRSHVLISKLPLNEDMDKKLILEIGDEIFKQNPLFPIICGNICGLCEEECNYKDETGAIRRRKIIQPIGDIYMEYLKNAPKLPLPKKDKIAVIGGGPSGLICAYNLSKKGYKVTIFDENHELGGALRYIPKYRLPTKILDSLINSIIRISHIKVEKEIKIGKEGKKSIEDLTKEGYKAIFIAPGTPNPRILTIESETPEFKELIQKLVDGDESQGIKFGINLLYDVDRGDVPYNLYKGKKIIVIGGGNVAFDVARTARRLGGKVTIMCLENSDKSSTDGIPADVEEIEGAIDEGIKIIYSRGVDGVITKRGKFRKIKTLFCKSVYTEDGGFDPKFDHNNIKHIKGDLLLITIGQGVERSLFEGAGLLNKKGRLDFDDITLMSNIKKGIFFGGDVNRIGFASEAMRDGEVAAESIDRYLSGTNMKKDMMKREYEPASIPHRAFYKSQPELVLSSPKERMNFEPFEKRYSWKEVIEEASRCLYCGPCKSCKGCVTLEFQDEIPDIVVDDNLCSGCAICISLCPFDALKLKEGKNKPILEIDDIKCKRCGVCVTACPSSAIMIEDNLKKKIVNKFNETDKSKIILKNKN